MNPIIFLDLETTSADTSRAEILELGLQAVDPVTFDPIDAGFARQYRARSPLQADPSALKIHGLDPNFGMCYEYIEADLRDYLIKHRYEAGPMELAGHNVGVFDVPILNRYLGNSLYTKLFHYRVRDTAIVTKWMMDTGLIPKLDKFGDIAGHFGIELTNYHRALPDAQDEAKVYQAMVRLGRAMGGIHG